MDIKSSTPYCGKFFFLLVVFVVPMLNCSGAKQSGVLKKMCSFVDKTIQSEYEKNDSSFLYFIDDYLNGEAEFIAHANKRKMIRINKRLHRQKIFDFIYKPKSSKKFTNRRDLADSIFKEFKIKYSYNVVRLSESYVSYYLHSNKTVSSNFIRKQQKDFNEFSPLYYSLFIKSRLTELNFYKNRELFAVLFWPYFCYMNGIDFYPKE